MLLRVSPLSQQNGAFFPVPHNHVDHRTSQLNSFSAGSTNTLFKKAAPLPLTKRANVAIRSVIESVKDEARQVVETENAERSIASLGYLNGVDGRSTNGAASLALPAIALKPSTSDKYEYELEIARRAVQLCSRLTSKVQKQLRAREDVAASKQDKSFVTVADYGVQAVVSWVLKEAFPDQDISMVAEEDTKDLKGQGGIDILQRVVAAVNECLDEAPLAGLQRPSKPLTAVEVLSAINLGNSSGGPTGRHWVLDPVDGTLGFVRDDQYAIALAMIDDGEVVLGALGCPNLPMRGDFLRYPHKYHRMMEKVIQPEKQWLKGCVMTARKGGPGTLMEPMVEEGGIQGLAQVPVRTSQVVDAAEATFCEPVEKANSNQGFTGKVADYLGMTSEPLRVYSMAKYAAIARGDAEIFMKFARGDYKEKIWDHAAGIIVVEEAGGKITDAGGKPLDFSKGRFLDCLDRGIVATSGERIHDAILGAVESSWGSSFL